MSLSNSTRAFATPLVDLTGVMADVKQHFTIKEYTVTTMETADGGFISIGKPGFFKAISGQNTGMNKTRSMPSLKTAYSPSNTHHSTVCTLSSTAMITEYAASS